VDVHQHISWGNGKKYIKYLYVYVYTTIANLKHAASQHEVHGDFGRDEKRKIQSIQNTPNNSSESALNFNKSTPFPLICKQFSLDRACC
jgi:hypothetical protein